MKDHQLLPVVAAGDTSIEQLLRLLSSALDLLDGSEPEEHGGGEQTDRGEERGPVPGALWPESDPDPQLGQHPPAQHGNTKASMCVCWVFILQDASFHVDHFIELLTIIDNFCHD